MSALISWPTSMCEVVLHCTSGYLLAEESFRDNREAEWERKSSNCVMRMVKTCPVHVCLFVVHLHRKLCGKFERTRIWRSWKWNYALNLVFFIVGTGKERKLGLRRSSYATEKFSSIDYPFIETQLIFNLDFLRRLSPSSTFVTLIYFVLFLPIKP